MDMFSFCRKRCFSLCLVSCLIPWVSVGEGTLYKNEPNILPTLERESRHACFLTPLRELQGADSVVIKKEHYTYILAMMSGVYTQFVPILFSS